MKNNNIKIELGGGAVKSVPLDDTIVRIGSKHYKKTSELITLVRVGAKRKYFRKVSPLIVQRGENYYKRSSIQKVDGIEISIYASDVVKCYDGEYHLKKNCVFSEDRKEWMHSESEKAIKEIVFCAISGESMLVKDAVPVYDVRYLEGADSSRAREGRHTIRVDSRGRPVAAREEPSTRERNVKSNLTNIRYVSKKYEGDLIPYKGKYFLRNECVFAYDNQTNAFLFVPTTLCKSVTDSQIFGGFTTDWSGDLGRATVVISVVDYGKKSFDNLSVIKEIALPFTKTVTKTKEYYSYAKLYVKTEDLELFIYSILYHKEAIHETLTSKKLEKYAKVLATNSEFDASTASLNFSNRGAGDVYVNVGNPIVTQENNLVAGMPFSTGVEVETSGGAIRDTEVMHMGFGKVGDRSVGAFEYISPILKGNGIINTINNISDTFGGKVMFDKRCSTHIHVGAYEDNVLQGKLSDPLFHMAVLKLGAHLEDEWFEAMPKFRYKNRYHCYSIAPYKGINKVNSDNLLGAYCFGGHESGMSTMDREKRYSLKNGASNATRWSGSRYKWLNIVGLLKPYARQRTVEFRLFPGTVDPEELKLYFMMSMSFVNYALNHTKGILRNVGRINTEMLFRESIKDYKLLHHTMRQFNTIKKINKQKLV